MDLTSAAAPPQQEGVAQGDDETEEKTKPLGRLLEDGTGALPDGTTWTKTSGTEMGANGYMKTWHLLSGQTADGVVFEDCWWEASDWAGYKELGATKTGYRIGTQGSVTDRWNETWREFMAMENHVPMVERSAHKVASNASGEAWEEKWNEKYRADGQVNRQADKWGKKGEDVWHARWGEDYTGKGTDHCVKWTDQWNEKEISPGVWQRWGDKWEEHFHAGKGEKRGETWSQAPDGGSYNKWWGEDHLGHGQVRKTGHSTSGEHWDVVEHMDTYYNPLPNMDYQQAVHHSPNLRNVKVRSRETLREHKKNDHKSHRQPQDGGSTSSPTISGGLEDF